MTWSALLAVLLLTAWSAVAIAATLLGHYRAHAARRAVLELERIRMLWAIAPIVPLTIHEHGRIGMSGRTQAWLGLTEPCDHVAGLAAAGFSADHLDELRIAIDASFASAAPIAFVLALPDSDRRLCITGGPLTLPGTRERVAMLWLSDVSDTQAKIDGLTNERARLANALDGMAGLIEAAPFPVWSRDAQRRLTFVNRAYVRAVEARDATDVARRKLELIDPMPAPPPAEKGSTAHFAPAIVAGQRQMMQVVEVPVGSGGSAGFAIDAQELEDARAALRRFVEAERAVLDRLSSAVVQFGPDRALAFHNLHFRRLFALDPAVLDDFPEFDRVLEQMREARRAPETRDFRAWRAERRAWFNSPDAVEETWLLPTGTHLRVVAQPLPDGGLLVIFEDRTEHLQLASARDTLLRVRSATFDNLFEAVAVFAGDGRLRLWNNRFTELWGLDEVALVEHPRLDMLVRMLAPVLAKPERAGELRELVRVATVDRQHRGGRLALRDGRRFDFAAVPLPDGNALFALLDVTASHGMEQTLRTRNETLEETNLLRGKFVARMSYELRVPLTSIAGFAEMLDSGYGGELPPTARDYVGAIRGAVERLQALIGDALDLSQSELGLLELDLAAIDMAEFVREAAQVAADQALVTGVRLLIEIAPDGGNVHGDRRRLRRCLDHLVRNALAHTPPEGSVVLSSRIASGQAEIVVADTGAGLPEDVRRGLLDSGESSIPAASDAEDAATRRGVGLPLARQLVTAHGGTFRLESPEGRGTVITIRLPLAPIDG